MTPHILQKLYNSAKRIDRNVTLEEVKDWLRGENTYTLHKDVRKNFSREKIFVTQPYEQYQADLVDMQAFSQYNDGYKYILTVIDCFSRYAYALPLKDKSGGEVKNALQQIFKKRKPTKLQTDRGKEFLNSSVQNFLKSNDIQYFTTFNTHFKCAIVERFNRTLKSKMFKYFSSRGTRKYLNVLQNFISSYNNTYHRTLKTAPVNVNEDNTNVIFYNIYGVATPRKYLLQQVKPKLQSGDKVRIKYDLNQMDKSYYPNWTDTIYEVDKEIKGRQKPMYFLKMDGKNLKQKFYPEEVQKIRENYYRIEKIIKRQSQNGKKGFLVKWLGYSDLHNSWVPEENIKRLNA